MMKLSVGNDKKIFGGGGSFSDDHQHRPEGQFYS